MTDDAVVLGKRKQRDADGDSPAGSTLFVSNLPYTATSTDLQTLFSDFAPVRSAFVVLENNSSKGVGYVSFAIREDAKTVLETIEKDGLELNGRQLRVQTADRKPTDKTSERKVKNERETPVAPRKSHPKLPKDPDAIRTVVISGIPTSVDKKALWKKVRKYEGAEGVELAEGEPGVAHAMFSSAATAFRAVEKLHAHVFKGSILSVTLKKRLENLVKAPVKDESSSTSVAPSRASRLIVRNMPWNISEKDLRALFLPFGPVYSIDIPTEQQASEEPKTKSTKPRAKGFAFVWFYSKKDAERAIAGVNGRAVEAGAVAVPTMNKKERQRLRRQLRKKETDNAGEEVADEDDVEKSDEDSDGERTDKAKTEAPGPGARVLAVDWALSKAKWEEAKAKTLEEQGEKASASDEGSEPESANEESSGDMSENNEESDEVEEDEEGEEHSDAGEAGRPMLPETDVGTTLFVRNVPYEATDDELRVLFRNFGPLRYARITKDVETGRSRGTGFACFWNKEDADKAIHQSELLNREAASTPLPKKNPFSLPSLLTPDPSSSLAQSLVIHGRTLDVSRAVTRETAVRLKDENERQREKADKRNLYLLREGVIFPDTPASATLSAADIEKRTASFTARRALLRSNPLLYISKTRLSIRQLPLFVSDRALKRLGIHAARAFEEEVKRGERQPLSADELRDEDQNGTETDASEKKSEKKKGKGKKDGRETGVKQAKVIKQADRVDGLTGKGRSRGYGFLEMTRHSDALRVLRWANNNQALGPLLEGWWKSEIEDLIKTLEKSKPISGDEGDEMQARIRRLKNEHERLKTDEMKKSRKTLIVEFSIENAQVVNRRKEKTETAKSVLKRPRSKHEADNDDDGESSAASPPKRRKVEKSVASKRSSTPDAKASASVANEEPAKPKNAIGSIIGRKRKVRKLKGKA